MSTQKYGAPLWFCCIGCLLKARRSDEAYKLSKTLRRDGNFKMTDGLPTILQVREDS